MRSKFSGVLLLSILCAGSLSARTEVPQCGVILSLACQRTAIDAAEKRLSEHYSLVLRMFDAGAVDPKAAFYFDKRKAFVAAERAWSSYKAAQCRDEGTLLFAGSGAATFTGDCLLRLTRERIKYLESLVPQLQSTFRLCKRDSSACKA
jgi:uncharacterized protein YecT (DUF1311 family)